MQSTLDSIIQFADIYAYVSVFFPKIYLNNFSLTVKYLLRFHVLKKNYLYHTMPNDTTLPAFETIFIRTICSYYNRFLDIALFPIKWIYAYVYYQLRFRMLRRNRPFFYFSCPFVCSYYIKIVRTLFLTNELCYRFFKYFHSTGFVLTIHHLCVKRIENQITENLFLHHYYDSVHIYFYLMIENFKMIMIQNIQPELHTPDLKPIDNLCGSI